MSSITSHLTMTSKKKSKVKNKNLREEGNTYRNQGTIRKILMFPNTYDDKSNMSTSRLKRFTVRQSFRESIRQRQCHQWESSLLLLHLVDIHTPFQYYLLETQKKGVVRHRRQTYLLSLVIIIM